MGLSTVASPAMWVGFSALVLLLLALDLGVFHRRAHAVGFREATAWSAFWVGLALLFNVGVYFAFGARVALEFLTGYVIEKALSVDNLFVFVVVLSYFAVPRELQHRVLFWGIVGALVMRAVFVALGSALLHTFHWVVYVFGGFLVLTGVKLLSRRGSEVHPERNPVLRLLQRLLPTVPQYHGTRFFVVRDGKRYATPLLLVIAVVEATDVVFAIDSIPAVFAVTLDPFIVYTSNIFAVLGLRALYFMLHGAIGRFYYLKVGIALILVFVGGKMILAPIAHVPIGVSLLVIALLILGSIFVSIVWPPRLRLPAGPGEPGAGPG